MFLLCLSLFAWPFYLFAITNTLFFSISRSRSTLSSPLFLLLLFFFFILFFHSTSFFSSSIPHNHQ